MMQADNTSYGALIRVCGLLPLAAILITACGSEEPAETAKIVTYNVDSRRISVSGISAGAMMATQLHVAHSSMFNGVALMAGGPWYCARGSMKRGLGACMTGGDIGTAELIAAAKQAAADGAIDSLDNLADDHAWIFRATLDEAVAEPVAQAAIAFYTEFIPQESVEFVGDVEAAHGFPTLKTGVTCNEMAPPYLNACDYDAAGELLSYLYPGLVEPVDVVETELLEVSLPGADDADLLETAYLFVPPACADGGESCPLHLVLHGCAQSAETVGTDFIEQSGYLPWAASNNIVLAFPQVEKSMVAPINPHACWDWWGYTGDDYATRSGAQMTVLAEWLGSLSQ